MWIFQQCSTNTKFPGVEFSTFDVLSDFEVREGIKEYSDWPTIPQVYLKENFLVAQIFL